MKSDTITFAGMNSRAGNNDCPADKTRSLSILCLRSSYSHFPAREFILARTVVLLLALLLFMGWLRPVTAQNAPVVVGSKAFTESYILGEIAKQKLKDAGFKDAQHKQGIGKTIIVWQALQSGAITCYPEYTGTISEEILKTKEPPTLENLTRLLKPLGIGLTGELGFNDTYALVMRKEQANKLHIKTISDLKTHPELNVKVSHEFLGRKDGWKPLVARYGLNMANVGGIEHGLAYEALKNGSIDLTDAYSTDAKISEYNLVTLDDDLNYFPQYKAVFLYRLDTPPNAVAALRTLEGKIDARRMTELNAIGERTKNYAQAASEFLGKSVESESNTARFARLTVQHLRLVVLSLFFAVLVGVPLGIVAARPGVTSQLILGGVGVLQTIPSLALLALLVAIRPLGISIYTAILALFLYSLLPIVRNTATGLQDIPGPVRESAAALGLEPSAQLRKVFLPMASRTILAGIKTSAIINVGTATLAALIAQGGYGEPIVSGLSLNDRATILEGAIPAAILAVLVQIGFDLLDRVLISPGLRLSHRSRQAEA